MLRHSPYCFALAASACTVLCAAPTLVLAGDAIIFSKPDVEIAFPNESREARIPEIEGRGLRFEQQAPSAIPYIPPPIRYFEPKKEKRGIFDEPEMFADKNENRNDDTAADDDKSLARKSFRPQSIDPLRRTEQDRALSPVKQFDWTPAWSEKRPQPSKDSSDPFASNQREVGLMGERTRSPDESKELGASLFGFFKPARRELTREQLERRAEFEKLLNPTFAPLATRNPQALGQEGSPLDIVKPPPAPVAPPPILGLEASRRSLDPMQGFNDQQRNLRGPTVDDLNRKTFGSVAPPSPSSSQFKEQQRKPLIDQPTFQAFPERRF